MSFIFVISLSWFFKITQIVLAVPNETGCLMLSPLFGDLLYEIFMNFCFSENGETHFKMRKKLHASDFAYSVDRRTQFGFLKSRLNFEIWTPYDNFNHPKNNKLIKSDVNFCVQATLLCCVFWRNEGYLFKSLWVSNLNETQTNSWYDHIFFIR